MFTPIPTEILSHEAEVTGLDLLHKTKFTKLRQVEPTPDLARVSEGITKLELMLDAVISVSKYWLWSRAFRQIESLATFFPSYAHAYQRSVVCPSLLQTSKVL